MLQSEHQHQHQQHQRPAIKERASCGALAAKINSSTIQQMHDFVRPGPAGSHLSDPIDTDMRKHHLKDKWATMRDYERTAEEEIKAKSTKVMSAEEEVGKEKAAKEQEAKDRVKNNFIAQQMARATFEHLRAQGPEAMEKHSLGWHRVPLAETPADVAMEQMREDFGSD